MKLLLPFIVALIVAIASSAERQSKPTTPPASAFHALIFTKTAGYRHASIEAGVKAYTELARKHHFVAVHTEDAETFTRDFLKQYAAVVFLNTTGDVLNDEQQSAFEKYVKNGGGYVGVHSASDTEYDWPFYGELVGAWFKSHPRVQDGVVIVENKKTPSTKHLPDRWPRRDEWYNFRRRVPVGYDVLLTLEKDSYEGDEMPGDHPIAWRRTIENGRAWYTGGGHTIESFSEPLFRQHLLGGLRWAAGRESSMEK